MCNTKSRRIKRFRAVLKNDPELWESYKANIAMAFRDEYHNAKLNKHHQQLSEVEIAQVANKAAEKFLTMLIDDV